jgi:hypothetical protein
LFIIGVIMNTAGLQVRIIDMHTVLLGGDKHWLRLSLPWLSRDISLLMEQIRVGADEDKLERIPALRAALIQLDNREPDIVDSPSKTICPRVYHCEAMTVHAGKPVPATAPIVYLCTPQQFLELDKLLLQREKGALLSIIVYSENAVMVGPVLPGKNYCPLCLGYLAAPMFGLQNKDTERRKVMLDTGLALARSVSRKPTDTIKFDSKALDIHPFQPFIGCPECVPPC